MDDHLLRAAFADLNLVKTNEFVICFTNHKLVYFDLGTSVCLERLYRRVCISTNNVRAQSILHNDSRQLGVADGRDFERILGNALRGRHRSRRCRFVRALQIRSESGFGICIPKTAV